MTILLKRLLIYLITISVVAAGLPPAASSRQFDTAGAESAQEAARYESSQPPLSPAVTNALGFSSLLSDTTQSVYFDEEEERNLVKEMIVWFIGAAFVGYFIVKVFLQGDTDEEPPPPKGKQLPQLNLSP